MNSYLQYAAIGDENPKDRNHTGAGSCLYDLRRGGANPFRSTGRNLTAVMQVYIYPVSQAHNLLLLTQFSISLTCFSGLIRMICKKHTILSMQVETFYAR